MFAERKVLSMSTFTRIIRRLSLLAVAAVLCTSALAWGNPPLAHADDHGPQELGIGELHKWDPIAEPNSAHTYRVELKKDQTTLISVLSIGITSFRPKLSSAALESGVCSGRASDSAGKQDVLISCTASNDTEATYTFTVSDSAGRAPTMPYAIFAKHVDGLSRIDTQQSKTKRNWGAYKVEVYEYLRVPTISRVSFSIEADQPVVGRIYEDSTAFGCEAPATCAVGNPNAERYFVVVWNLQERSNITVSLKN